MKCIISHCPNELSKRAKLKECAACRAVFRYWLKRPTESIIKRQESLSKWQERMIVLATKPKGSKHAKAIKKAIHTGTKG